MDIEIGDNTFTKKPNILEEIAYRDTWGKGADSFIAMIYERLILTRDLLAEMRVSMCTVIPGKRGSSGGALQAGLR